MSTTPEDDDRFAGAVELPPQLSDKLVALEKMVQARRPDKAAEAEYEALRDEVLDALDELGMGYYVDENGMKKYAYPVRPEKLYLDIDEVVALHAAGKLPDLDLDEVAPRQTSPDGVRAAVAARRIPAWVAVKHIHIRRGTGHVGFAYDAPDEAG